VTRTASTTKNGVKGKGKGRKKRGTDATDTIAEAQKAASATAKSEKPAPGVLEQVFGLLGAFISSNVIIAILCVTIVFLVWRQGRANPRRSALAFSMPHHNRIAAYEDVWRSEENELWKWLEERVGMDKMNLAAHSDSNTWEGRRPKLPVIDKLEHLDALGEREIIEAVRLTKERLLMLEEAIHKQKKHRETTTPSIDREI
jgi:hypothetical protein